MDDKKPMSWIGAIFTAAVCTAGTGLIILIPAMIIWAIVAIVRSGALPVIGLALLSAIFFFYFIKAYRGGKFWE